MTESTTLNGYILPPLPQLDLPPLPPISDEALERRVFTHSSYVKKQKRGTDFLDLDEELEDNEKLEFVGDGLLGVFITRLIHTLWPNMQQGASTVLKSHLVANSTLTQISIRYNLPSRLRAERAQLYALQHLDKLPANLLEAYIAGVFEDYLHTGHGKSAQGLIKLPTPPRTPTSLLGEHGTSSGSSGNIANGKVLPTGISPPSQAVTEGQALDNLAQWLRPLFTPIAQWVLSQLQQEQLRLSGPGADGVSDADAFGALMRLNQWCSQQKRQLPSYSDVSQVEGMWRVKVVLTMRDESIITAEATRKTKKQASSVAAYAICQELGIM